MSTPDGTVADRIPKVEQAARPRDRPRGGPGVWARAALRFVRARVRRVIFPDALKLEAERLGSSETYYRSLIENALDTITLIDEAGTIKYESPSVERVLGYRPEDLLGRNVFEYVHPADRGLVLSEFDRLLQQPGRLQAIDLRFRHSNGQWRDMEVIGRNLLDDPIVQGVVVNARDITTRKEAEAQLLYDAFHDKLTGLPNRALFMDRLAQAMKRSRREAHPAFGMLFLDLDRFKLVNDSLGHTAGDRLLVDLSHRLEDSTRPGDTVARLGGDEFTVLLDGIASVRAAERVAERIHEQLQRPFHVDGQELFVSASIGIAVDSQHYAKPEEVLRDADLAMYRAKALGRARHEIFDQTMHGTVMASLRLETELRHGIEDQALRLFYQPIVSLETGTLRGFEALVRWQHPERGLLQPGEFLHVAEESGLIVPLGWWVLEEAAREAMEWHRMTTADSLFVSVNLSARQFAQPDLVEGVARIMRQADMPGHLLKLELTEGTVMRRPEEGALILHELRDLGVGLCIDDFGTGYSSLAYLHQFPMDTLKIDQSFTSLLSSTDQKAGIVRSVVGLGKDLEMDVIAEGIETEGQWRSLRRLCCPHGQGHLFSRAVPAAQARAMVRSDRSWPLAG